MIDALTAQLATPAASLSSTPVTSSNGTALSSDVVRFQAALNAPDPSATAAASSAPLGQPASAVGSSVPLQPQATVVAADPNSVRTLGDAILDGLKSSSNDLSRAWQAAGDVLAKPDPSIADMLRLQMMLVQSTVQYELLGKTISKTTQNLDHVLRTQ